MKRNRIAVLFFLVSLLASCSKVDALFNNGEPVTEQRNLGQRFEVVSMYNNVNVKLVQDSHPHLELTCPKNLIDKVKTEIVGDTLFIRNENDFNWLRSYDYDIDLTVYYDSLSEVHFASNGWLRCTDPIRGIGAQYIDTTEYGIDTLWVRAFYLYINEGSGDIDLNLNCHMLKNVFNNGTSKVTLRGSAGYAEHYLRSYGVIHAEQLNSNLVSVSSQSTNDLYVWARTVLTARVYSIGNVYYKGNPWLVREGDGEGQVIKLE
ncbi:MAG: DUF2807 domain-containing protein [Muribaculaceae bacterium]|nr:DUF2807 domain-containing protein [Muribaculaceae bacterium]